MFVGEILNSLIKDYASHPASSLGYLALKGTGIERFS
jgi:hypothetical protein